MPLLKAQPLLKFEDGAAVLAPEGAALVRELAGQICPVIFVGDGRSGKSYLASSILGEEDIFLSSDSAESVTEGIDVAALPLQVSEAKSEEYLLVLDCEGGNNAMAAIRSLVNIFGLLLGSQVVFVTNGMATEQALQTLGLSLAARSLIRLDARSKLPEQELLFVVNKNTLRYDVSALDKILDQKFDEPARQELRDSVRQCFPERSFFTVPIFGTPSFDASLSALRSHLFERRKPLVLGGLPVTGKQLVGLMELIVVEVQKSEEISMPSMNRFVIYEGYLMPLVNALVEYAQSSLPEVADYIPDLAKRNPIEDTLRKFDDSCNHISFEDLKGEAKDLLSSKLHDMWHWLEASNEALGNEVKDTVQETREVEVGATKAVLGGKGLLKGVVVTTQLLRHEERTVLHRRRGGDPDYLPWRSRGTTAIRMKESAFEPSSLTRLPIRRGQLMKASPNLLRAFLQPLNSHRQMRICILQDGHLMWWDADGVARKGQAKGCINFLIHRAKVFQDPNLDTAFVVAPASPNGWPSPPSSFTGDPFRQFSFDTDGSEYGLSDWMAAVEKHVEFGKLAADQLGLELHSQMPVRKPFLTELRD